MKRSWLGCGLGCGLAWGLARGLGRRLQAAGRIGIAVALAGAVALALAVPGEARARFGTKEYFGDLEVVDHNGRRLRFYDDLVKDRIFIVNFLYTTCRDICPLAASKLADLQDMLGDEMGRKYFFYSITVDPEVDTPEVLKEYAKTFGAGRGWLFLTGKPETNRVLRWKLGDRGSRLNDHRNEVLLGNGFIDDWARNSIMGDLKVLEFALRMMDPNWRARISKRAPRATYVDLEARPGEALYTRLCKGCHTVGKGVKVGPDLAGVAERRQRDWLLRFIADPEKMRREKDPIAMSLVARFPTVRMPPMGIGERDASDLLKFIADTELRQAQRHPLKSLAGLTTHKGKDFTAEAVKGHPVAVFFGFTHCPDVCPTTLMDWSNVLTELGEDGDELKVLFVTVDPERDTQKSLAEYLGSFDPRIVALTGQSKAIKRAARVFEAFHKRIEGKDGGYTFDHTTNVYLVGRDGKLAGKVNLRTPPERRRALIDKVLAQKVAAGR